MKKLLTLEQHIANHVRPVVGPNEDGCRQSTVDEVTEMLHIMRRNQNLIAYCAAHGVNAYENELGSVTMENTFFNTPEIEYVNVSTLAEVRIQLNY